MPAPLGGIGQQVADNLFELGKSTVQSAVKVGGDVVKDSIEQITGAPGRQSSQPAERPTTQPDSVTGGVDREKEATRAAAKRRYEQVKAELEQYRQRRAQQDKQIALENNQQEQENQQKKVAEKQEKESFVQKMLRKVGAGAHGETVKQKE
jgi:hypothetical protein